MFSLIRSVPVNNTLVHTQIAYTRTKAELYEILYTLIDRTKIIHECDTAYYTDINLSIYKIDDYHVVLPQSGPDAHMQYIYNNVYECSYDIEEDTRSLL